MNPDPKQVLTELLVLSAQRGSEAAFRDLHGLWTADLRRMALVRVEKTHAADEVLTDVWLAIARGLSRLDDPACFPRWAFRIVDRRCTDWVRKVATERRHEAAASEAAEEIAEILGIPAGTVKSRLFSVSETLKQQIEAQST